MEIDMPVVTLPDGSQREFDHPVTVEQVARSIGTGLAKAAVVGKVDGSLVDLSHTVDRDAEVAIVTGNDRGKGSRLSVTQRRT
jgi:TGS domain.